MVLLIVIPALCVTAFLNFQHRATERARVMQTTATISALAAANEESHIRHTRQVLETLTQFPFLLLTTNREFSATHLSNLRKLSPDYANFGIIETNGYLFCDTDPTNQSVYLGDRSYFQRVLKTKQFSVGRFQTGRLTRTQSVNFAQPVFDDHGTLARVVYASLRIDPLARPLNEIDIPAGGAITLVDADGAVIARHSDDAATKAHALTDALPLATITSAAGTNFEATAADGVSRLYAISPVANGKEQPLFVVVEVPSTVLFGPANSALLRTSALMLLMGVLIWLIVQAYAKKFFLVPINVLSHTARSLADGSFNARAGNVGGAVELTTLAATLDEMAEHVQNRTTQLLRANESLRNQIAERELAERRLREQEEQKKQLEEQFLRAQRMESIGALAGGVAHDLNNALVPIVMGAEMLREVDDDPDERKKILDLIATSGKRCTQMVNQIVRFARGKRNSTEAVSVQQLLDEMAKLATETFPKSIKIEIDTPRDLLEISADPTELHQILMNLCVNARDAMPEGGTLRLRATNVDFTNEALPAGLTPGQFIELVVADTGTGIPPEIRQRIFEPFFTTKAPDRGTGLGLSTVLNLIKKHHGGIDVQSLPGRGTQFLLYFPAISRSAKSGAPSTLEKLRPGQGELILLADDEQAIVELARSALENYGYRVVCASNGLQAVSSFEARKHEIKLVIMDTDMPFLTGIEAIKSMRRLSPTVRIILASATKQETAMFTRGELHGVTRLPKPYDVEQLLQAIEATLNTPAFSSPPAHG